MGQIKEFNTSELKTISIDGEPFDVRPIGAGMMLDLEEISVKMQDIRPESTTDEDGKVVEGQPTPEQTAELLDLARQMFDHLESLMVAKGNLSVKHAVARVPQDRLQDFVKMLNEL